MLRWLIINFVEDRAYLSRNKPLRIDALDIVLEGRKFEKPASWLLEVISYSQETSTLFVKAIEYRCCSTPIPTKQETDSQFLAQIQNIKFKSLDTAGVLLTLGGKHEGKQYKPKQRSELADLLEDSAEYSFEEFDTAHEPETGPTNLIAQRNQESEIRIYVDEFSIPIRKLNFGFGCVWLKRKLHPLDGLYEVQVFNEELREEFDAIKGYFAKVLGNPNIHIRTELHMDETEVVEFKAISEEINRINSELIQSVKFELIRSGLKKKINVEVDKALFNADEFFDRFGMDQQGFNALYNSTGDLLEDVLQITKTKHYKNLRYLSEKHASHILKLRFVLRPFSFVFLLEAEQNYHLIWETLDTAEATYVWKVVKDKQALRLALKKIEDIINVVKVQGKIAYISTSDEPFRRVFHDYSDLNDGFIRWKGELESGLI